MPLTTSRQILLDAQQGGYAVGAFNVENMEMAQAVIEAAEELHAPVILQTTPSTIKYGGLDLYYANVAALAKHASIPVVLHLDHGDSFSLAVQALHAGYTSIMIDGSRYDLEENIALTSRVTSVATPCGIPVEAELGKVGGKEDDLETKKHDRYTDPQEAKEFVERTGVSSLAIAIGTAHGVYNGIPKLNVECLKKIRALVTIPLVLHGASGLSEQAIQECIQEGICKVNFATDLRIAFSDGVKQVLREKPDTFDPKKYCRVGKEFVKQTVISRITVCGCQGRA